MPVPRHLHLLDAEDQQVLLKAAAIIDRIADSHP